MPARRPLSFDRLDQILPDVERLGPAPTMVGHWTLGEVCDHLAKTFALTIRNPRKIPPATPTPEQDAARQAFFEARTTPEGNELPDPRLAPTPGVDLATSIESLRTAIAAFELSDTAVPTHFSLGPMTHDDWRRLHCIHSAHHLSFALPA